MVDPEPGDFRGPRGGAHHGHPPPPNQAAGGIKPALAAGGLILGVTALAAIITVIVLFADTMTIIVQSGTTKTQWMEAMAAEFNNSGYRIGNTRIFVKLYNTGSPLQPELKPDVWSPSTTDWIAQANADFQAFQSRQIIMNTSCPDTVQIPLGIVMWKSMAEALGWPNQISWRTIAALAADRTGWGLIGRPSLGTFKFGHGNPISSTSGRLSVLSMLYAFANKTGTLLVESDLTNPEVINGTKSVESQVFHYGGGGADLLNRMVRRGLGYLHAVTSYETNVIRWNRDFGAQMVEPFVLVYPSEGTFWNPNPICIIDNANWTRRDAMPAAKLFVDFILRPENQRKALQYGIRPADRSIGLTEPFSLANGVNPQINSETIGALGIPNQLVVDKAIELWSDVKAPATIVMVIDVSGSMSAEGKMVNAIKGALAFIDATNKNDILRIFKFSSNFLPVRNDAWPATQTLGPIREELKNLVSVLSPGGATSLYDATVNGYNELLALRAADQSSGIRRNYGVVIMTDGEDTGSINYRTPESMLRALPSGEDAGSAHFFTIAYGEEPNKEILKSIASQTNGLFFSASTVNIQQIFEEISTEF